MDKRIKNRLKPLLKYPGGKGSELETIICNLPKNFSSYIEPFVGGGAAFFAIEAETFYINDISEELMLLYKYVKEGDGIFFAELNLIDKNWQQLKDITKSNFTILSNMYFDYKQKVFSKEQLKHEINNFIANLNGTFNLPLFSFDGIDSKIFKKQLENNLYSKLLRIKKNEEKNEQNLNLSELEDNIECSIKSAYYMHFREIYNSAKINCIIEQRRVAIFFFIREYCYSSMFRFNAKKEFNVPYGGISYNKKNMASKILYFNNKILTNKLALTELFTLDFREFINRINICKNDFMFLDPPYDTVFSEYDKNSFDQNDQIRLSNYLINECPCKFMLIIKKTDFIEQLYKDNGLVVKEINKNYSVSFRNRNKKNVVHLVVTNY